MNLHQFRFVQEAVRRNLNLTETAKALYTSQPGISKAILELEDELGVDIFARHGKRLRRITEPGQQVLKSIEVIMREVGQPEAHRRGVLEAGRRHAVDRHHAQPGALLPARAGGAAAQALSPRCRSVLHQGTPAQVARMLQDEVGRDRPGHRVAGRLPTTWSSLPCYEWQHVIVVPARPPAGRRWSGSRSSDLAAEPLITYHPSFTGRTRIDAGLRARAS